MGTRGSGSLRQRGPGRWEVRVSLGPHAQSGRTIYRSITVQGDLAEAQRRRVVLAAQAGQVSLRIPIAEKAKPRKIAIDTSGADASRTLTG